MKAVIYEKEGPIAIIKFNRPEVLNAYNRDVMKGLMAAFELAHRDTEVRVIVWKGEGRAWCAGADIKATVSLRSSIGNIPRQIKY